MVKLGAERVEGAHPDVAGGRTDQLLDALPHLAGRRVGEGDGEDVPRTHADLVDQVGDAMSEDPRLARAGPGQDQHWAVHDLRCFVLGIVEGGEHGHGMWRPNLLARGSPRRTARLARECATCVWLKMWRPSPRATK